jgi:putative ABC transport system substrate-binding protein
LAWQEAYAAAVAEGLALASHPVRTPGDVEAAFTAMGRQGTEGLLIGAEALTSAQRRHIVALAAAHRLPAAYPLREFVQVGGLMAYGPNVAALYWQSAAYVDRLLRGATPADLPITAPRQYELVLNHQTARLLGLTFPSALVEQADEVFD